MTISQTNPDRLLPDDQARWGRIVLVDDTNRTEAVERLVSTGPDIDRDHARRFLDYARENRIDLRGQWVRLDDLQRIRETVLTVPNPGRTAMVFASAVRCEADLLSVAGLVDHACRLLPHSFEGDESADGRPAGPLAGPLAGPMVGRPRVQLAQVLLDPGHDLERRMFLAAGFRHLAHLSYLERSLPGPRVPVSDWPPNVTITPYDDSLRDELIAILHSSYEDTLDCPGLCGLRSTEDILSGHLATGQFDPSMWTLMRVDGRPAGALLLNPSAQANCVELVYLGLAQSARGRRLGWHLLAHGLRMVRARTERVVTLAVDEDNTPALRLYRGFGFKRVLRRVALIRPVGGSDEDSVRQG